MHMLKKCFSANGAISPPGSSRVGDGGGTRVLLSLQWRHNQSHRQQSHYVSERFCVKFVLILLILLVVSTLAFNILCFSQAVLYLYPTNVDILFHHHLAWVFLNFSFRLLLWLRIIQKSVISKYLGISRCLIFIDLQTYETLVSSFTLLSLLKPLGPQVAMREGLMYLDMWIMLGC